VLATIISGARCHHRTPPDEDHRIRVASISAVRAQLAEIDLLEAEIDSLKRVIAIDSARRASGVGGTMISHAIAVDAWSEVVQVRREQLSYATLAAVGARALYEEMAARATRDSAARSALIRYGELRRTTLAGVVEADESLIEAEVVFRNTESGFRDALREFSWPPPNWTSAYALPDSLLGIGTSRSMGLVFDRLVAALRRGNIQEYAFYKTRGGFAVVARMETIENDGTPKPNSARWTTSLSDLPSDFSGWKAYFEALLRGKPGHYRVIVLVFTTAPLEPSKVTPSAETVRDISKGSSAVPKGLRHSPVGNRVGYALIYEFDRRAESSPAEFVAQSQITPVTHLVKAGLWTEQQLR
jgi:hypothetical protein